jgi:hypothetical protein
VNTQLKLDWLRVEGDDMAALSPTAGVTRADIRPDARRMFECLLAYARLEGRTGLH